MPGRGGEERGGKRGRGGSHSVSICRLCITPPPSLAKLGLLVLLPALLGLMWQLCVWSYIMTVVHLVNIY